jgi:hypothetical protein
MSSVPVSVIRTTAGLVIIATLIWSGCSDSPSEPDLPDFLLESVVFTGDSIGEAPAAAALTVATRNAAKGEPYCEVTVSWAPPHNQRVVCYSVHRALSPGIPSGAVDYRTVGTTAILSFPDSDSLSWGTTYYYAVSALTADSTVLWSNEEPFTTPTSDYPVPSVLEVEDLLMGQCLLHWSPCPDTDFSSYTVMVRLGIYSPWDTIGVFHNASDTLAVGSANPDYPVYFQVTTTDDEGHSSISNIVQYTHNGALPWRIGSFGYLFQQYVDPSITGDWITSYNGNYLYFRDRVYSPPYYECTYGINRINTIQGGYRRRQTANELSSICHVSSLNGVLVSYDDTDGKYISLLDENTLQTVSTFSVDFTCSAMIAGEMDARVILCPEGSQTSLVLDMISMSFVDTLDFTISQGQVLGGYGTYIWGGAEGLCRLDPASLAIDATCPITVSCNPVATSNGDLCVLSGTGNNNLYRLDPFSLDVLDIREMPELPFRTVIYEASGDVFAYYRNHPFYPDSIIVMNTGDLGIAGKVYLSQEMTNPMMIALPEQEKIWCLFWTDVLKPGYLSIVR